MYEAKTVGDDTIIDGYTDPLQSKMKEDVAKMRTSLLASSEDTSTLVSSIKQVTLLRICHELSRIVRHIELMDKLEDKLYLAIDNKIDMLDYDDNDSIRTLLYIQSKLTDNMIESHKLLQPYVELANRLPELSAIDIDTYDIVDDKVVPKSTRDKVRIAAQNILSQIENDE